MKNGIKDIVIYKSIENGIETIKSCIFYDDDTTILGTYDDGIEAIKLVAKEKNIKSKDVLKEMINKEMFHTMTEEQLKLKVDTMVEEKLNSHKKDEEEVVYEEEYIGNNSEYIDFEEEDEEEYEEEEDEEESFIERAGEKLQKDNLGVKLVAAAVGIVVGAAIYTACNRKSKTGEIVESNLPTPTSVTSTETTETDIPTVELSDTDVNVDVQVYDNDLYYDYSYAELLNVTQNEFQKNSMINLGATLTGFNGVFADAYVESGNDIKAALSFDETVALQQAYNSYTKDEIKAYFNGYEADAVNMSNAYKSASLQLMGAYVIETSENPVDMSNLIDSQEGKDFYKKYNDMFIAAKEATGDEQLALVEEFYNAVREDFPITKEVKTEGISNSENYEQIKDYKISVAPIIAAAEMCFQNLKVDYTLDTIENNISEIDFINDIGLCNLADDKFEKIEIILLAAEEDNTNPLFEQYRNAIITDLENNNSYVIDDDHRELANLMRFKDVVDGDNKYLGMISTTYAGYYGEAYTTSYGANKKTNVSNWEESSTEYYYESNIIDAPIPPEVQAALDKELEEENNNAQAQAQADANTEAQKQQELEDQNAQNIATEIGNEENQLQNNINSINTTIDNGGTVNENNYPNIDFNDNYTDTNGNLSGSVQNVTLDGTGAYADFPDPNVSGQAFDASVIDNSVNSFSVNYGDYSAYAEWVDENAYIEYDESYIPYDENGNPIGGYQYTK